MPVFMPLPYPFDDYSFEIWFEIRKCNAPALFYFLKTALAIWGHLWNHINFRIAFSIGIELNL